MYRKLSVYPNFISVAIFCPLWTFTLKPPFSYGDGKWWVCAGSEHQVALTNACDLASVENQNRERKSDKRPSLVDKLYSLSTTIWAPVLLCWHRGPPKSSENQTRRKWNWYFTSGCDVSFIPSVQRCPKCTCNANDSQHPSADETNHPPPAERCVHCGIWRTDYWLCGAQEEIMSYSIGIQLMNHVMAFW